MSSPILARDIMVKRLITLSPETNWHEAAKLLLKHHISGAPVVNEKNELVGMFSEQDMMRALVDAAYDELPSSELRNYMSCDLYTINEDVDLLSIVQAFQNEKLRRLPVVRERKLMGQLSRRDVIAAAVKLLEPAVVGRKSAILYLSGLREPPPEAPLE
ncbi:MAG: CBS domain-containing protein [Planctomycetota bacterium]